MVQNLLHQLFHGPPKVPNSVRKVLQIQNTSPIFIKRKKWRRRPPKYIKGVSNGNFFRVKIPPPKKTIPGVPKLPPTNPMPKPLTPPPALVKAKANSPVPNESYPNRLLAWLRSNGPVILLNFGSMCSLIGFTRSDILELRSFAFTGNVMFVFYVLGQQTILWASIAWSSLFASVNAWKILEILHERNAEVHMSEDQQKVFVDHFMAHGITPKQFERIEGKAEKLHFKEGDVLVRSGQKLEYVYLIIGGSTRANVLGRHLTAASTNPNTKGDQKAGGDSGVWVGEMVFLDKLGELEQGKTRDASDEKGRVPGQKRVGGSAIYTIICDEDCTVLSWSHEDMTELMGSSKDVRSALTRAMTSALVGKIVNLTISRTQQGLPRWTSWLSDWRNNDGAKVQLKSVFSPVLPEDKGNEETPSLATN